MDLDFIKEKIRKFRDDRNWMQFHNPKNMAISISIEAAELLEHFQWRTLEQSVAHATEAKDEIGGEVADIAVYLIEFCDNTGIDLEQAILNKIERNAEKYPVDKFKNSARKYNES
ncbi:MAG: nucleotide pyrophosphohydrolase [Planctomycetes bacterium]|nr:nucleotide pyrophosphohydrolase [Planctomycetota bacterium]